MKLFNKKETKDVNQQQQKFFIRVMEENWKEVVDILRKDYGKHDIRLVDESVELDGKDLIFVQVHFDGSIGDYINVLVDLGKKGINKIDQNEVEKK